MPTEQRVHWRTVITLLLIAGGLFILDARGDLEAPLRVVRGPWEGILAFVSAQTDKVAEALQGPRSLREAQIQIDVLEQQIDELERENELLQELRGENELLRNLYAQALERPDIERVLANVIARDTSPTFRSILIDIGTDDGIFVGMPVEDAQGLVGQVFRTTSNMSQVILVTDNTSSIPGRLADSRATGIVHGTGIGGVMVMEWIDLDATVTVGEVVATSGLGGSDSGGLLINRFPSDLLLGRVVEVQRSEAELFQSAIIQPAADINNLEIVFVLTNAPVVDTTIFEDNDE